MELQRSEQTLAHDGITLCTCNWHIDQPAAAMLFVPGYNHYQSPFYDWFANRLAPGRIACYGIDLESFGKTPLLRASKGSFVPCCQFRGQLRAYVPDFNSLVTSVIRYARKIKSSLPKGTPLFLHGESMGGGIAIIASALEPGLFAGAILVAPMARLNTSSHPPQWVQVLGSFAAAIIPWAPIAPIRDITPLCFKDPIKLAEAMEGLDPNRYKGRMRIATALQLRDAAARVQQCVPKVEVPLLVQQGGADHVTPGAGDFVYSRATLCLDRTLVKYEGAWHALFAEPVDTRRRLVMDTLAWIGERVPVVSRACAASYADSLPLMPVGVHCQSRPEGIGPFRDGSVWSASHTPVSEVVRASMGHLD